MVVLKQIILEFYSVPFQRTDRGKKCFGLALLKPKKKLNSLCLFVLSSGTYLSALFSSRILQYLLESVAIDPKYRGKKEILYHCTQNLRFLFAISLQKNLGVYLVLSLVPSNPEHYFSFCVYFLLLNNFHVPRKYKLHLLFRINIYQEFSFWILNAFRL